MSVKEKEKSTIEGDTGLIKQLILFNSQHLWNKVVEQLHKATGFDILHCEQIAVIAHTTGKAVVKSGEYEELVKIDTVLKEIGLITEIQ